MADEARGSTVAANSTGPQTVTPQKKLPKGVVLGKDGKPCRSCTSFSDWKKSARSITTAAAASSQTPSIPLEPTDCPPDVEALGRSSWTLLHSITASYPVQPTATDKSNVTLFLSLFAKIYPCWVCAEDFQAYLEKEKVKADTRDEFGKWMCEAHNEVNRKLGKPTFDCAKWEERWRTGWADGSCD